MNTCKPTLHTQLSCYILYIYIYISGVLQYSILQCMPVMYILVYIYIQIYIHTFILGAGPIKVGIGHAHDDEGLALNGVPPNSKQKSTSGPAGEEKSGVSC